MGVKLFISDFSKAAIIITTAATKIVEVKFVWSFPEISAPFKFKTTIISVNNIPTNKEPR